MKRIVINKCFGGFSISEKGLEFMANRGCSEASVALENLRSYQADNVAHGWSKSNSGGRDFPRDNWHLIAAVEILGREANGDCAELAIIEIPEDVNWTIDDYDGAESVVEVHRTW